jgi:hypothetical protein
MCLNIRKFPSKREAEKAYKNPTIATRDITVYKLLGRGLIAPFRQGFRYEKGMHYYQEAPGIFTHSISKSWYPTDEYTLHINRGLHAYNNKAFALTKSSGYYAREVYKFIIPKGALYYRNDNEICSSELIFPYNAKPIK